MNAHKLHPFMAQLHAVPNASGSCYLELNKSKVVVSVYGPMSMASNAVNYDAKFSNSAQVTCDFRFAAHLAPIVPHGKRAPYQRGEQTEVERNLSADIVKALSVSICLDKYPKSEIRVHVLVLETNGSPFPAAVVCASAALSHAGIELYDMVTAVSVTSSKDDEIILDDTTTELMENAQIVTLAYMSALQQVTFVKQEGRLTYEETQKLFHLCVDACAKRHEALKTFLLTAEE